jgi:hypothetical protein
VVKNVFGTSQNNGSSPYLENKTCQHGMETPQFYMIKESQRHVTHRRDVKRHSSPSGNLLYNNNILDFFRKLFCFCLKKKKCNTYHTKFVFFKFASYRNTPLATVHHFSTPSIVKYL